MPPFIARHGSAESQSRPAQVTALITDHRSMLVRDYDPLGAANDGASRHGALCFNMDLSGMENGQSGDDPWLTLVCMSAA